MTKRICLKTYEGGGLVEEPITLKEKGDKKILVKVMTFMDFSQEQIDKALIALEVQNFP